MPATTIGTGSGNWGVAANETGIIMSGFDLDTQASTKELPDREGCAVGLAVYNEKIAISISGYVMASTTPTQKVGSVITLTNTVALTHLQATTGKIVCENVKRARANEDFERIDITATLYPLITT
jgi:hypothetical protein